MPDFGTWFIPRLPARIHQPPYEVDVLPQSQGLIETRVSKSRPADHERGGGQEAETSAGANLLWPSSHIECGARGLVSGEERALFDQRSDSRSHHSNKRIVKVREQPRQPAVRDDGIRVEKRYEGCHCGGDARIAGGSWTLIGLMTNKSCAVRCSYLLDCLRILRGIVDHDDVGTVQRPQARVELFGSAKRGNHDSHRTRCEIRLHNRVDESTVQQAPRHRRF